MKKIDKKVKEEIWKDIPEYEGLYQASNLGRIKRIRFINGRHNFEKERICSQIKNIYGYMQVPLSKNGKTTTKRVHRLVMEAFYGKSNLQVDHIDGNKQNNNLSNLEYVTPKENTRRAWQKGFAKYTEETRKKQIQTTSNNGISKKVYQYDLSGNLENIFISLNEVERVFGYNSANICLCCNGKIKTAYGYIWRYNQL